MRTGWRRATIMALGNGLCASAIVNWCGAADWLTLLTGYAVFAVGIAVRWEEFR